MVRFQPAGRLRAESPRRSFHERAPVSQRGSVRQSDRVCRLRSKPNVPERSRMKYGYARTRTGGQTTALQLDALQRVRYAILARLRPRRIVNTTTGIRPFSVETRDW